MPHTTRREFYVKLPTIMKVDNEEFYLSETFKACNAEFDSICSFLLSPDGMFVYVSAILHEYIECDSMGLIYAIVIGKLELKTRTWVWTNKMSRQMVSSIKRADILEEMVELTVLPEHPDVVSLVFRNMETGNDCRAQFNSQNGTETIIIS